MVEEVSKAVGWFAKTLAGYLGFLDDDGYFLAFIASLIWIWACQGLALRPRPSWKTPPTDLFLVLILTMLVTRYLIPLLILVV